MKEKPARKTNRLAVASLWLGVLAVLTSIPFLMLLSRFIDGMGFLWNYVPVVIAPGNLLLSLAAVIAGRLAGKKGETDKGKAIAGIVLGVVAILLAIASTLIILGSGLLNVMTIPGMA
jgi:hypothetical protein